VQHPVGSDFGQKWKISGCFQSLWSFAAVFYVRLVFYQLQERIMGFFEPSLKAISCQQGHIERKYNFPFDLVPLGKSFHVGKDQVLNINVLRALASRFGLKLKRRFKVVDHGEHGYEVFFKEIAKPKEPVLGLGIGDYGDIPGRYRG